ncbi:MAG: GNAT family N-acetyltransferase [Janthinobacterium lividum]
MTSSLTVRDATTADAAGCAAVYAPYVLGTAASFETEPPGVDEVSHRIEAALRTHAWVVAERDGELVGYAYATAYKPRPAYRWTCEVSVYVAGDRQHGGVGRSLYDDLLERLSARGYRSAVASMTLPNPASAHLHASLGFTPGGVLERVGWKDGRWHDVALLRRDLGPGPHGSDPPAEPV